MIQHELINELRELEKSGNMTAVLKGAMQLETSFPDSDLMRSHAAAFYIDSGSVLNDLSAINKGINIIEVLLETQFSEDATVRRNLKYNLSNGYSSQYEILVKQGDEQGANEAPQKAKEVLQNLLVERQELESSLHASVMTNYANILDHLGRTIEAIDQYLECLNYFPKHAMAMGNCGIALKRILDSSNRQTSKNLHKAWNLLNTACNMQDEILQFSNPAAIEWFEAHLEDLVKYIEFAVNGGLDGLKKWEVHREEAHGHPEAPNWLSKINRDRLLLTLNLSPLNSVEECVDDLFFQSLITEIGEDGTMRFTTLANSLNVIKEEYATARYLYYYIEDSKKEFTTKSKITNYANALDYADFGLAAGLLKTSYRLAADCLDKVAGFINEYFELNHDADHVIFSNVWFVDLNPKKGLHPILNQVASRNQFVKALLDVKRDWYLQTFPVGRLKDVRNKATHSKLVLYWLLAHNQEDRLGVWSAEEFRNATYFMLRLTKASIIYSVSAIDVEEAHKSANSKQLTAPMIFDIGKGITDWINERENEL